MAFNAVLNSQSFDEVQVAASGHGPVGISWTVVTGNGTLSAGTIVALDSNNKVVPYGETSKELGTGDGSTTDFTGTFDEYPLQPGTVEVTAGSASLNDDGCGRLCGDGSGTVNYVTGEVSVSFSSAPASGVTVSATAKRRAFGVLANTIDTDEETTATVYTHGTVVKDSLLVGGSAAATEDVVILAGLGIYAL